MTHTVAFHTLGCKVNQCETDKIREAMERAGFEAVPFDSPADVYVINTCTVTQTADSKSRYAIRKARRLNPNAIVVATGCYAQLEADRLAAIPGIDLIIPNEDKGRIPQILNAECRMMNAECPESGVIHHSSFIIHHSRTRAFVKVQDGCDHFCAYCVVPFARPEMWSRPVDEVVSEIEAIAAAGHKEIVLTGIRLGSYVCGNVRLPGLIEAAAKVEGIRRIRLSSIEPWEVDDALLDAMQNPKVCRHLHIPLQSGDDAILAAMGRPYTRADYLDLASRVRSQIPGIGITTDVIVGFPGETEEAFDATVNLIESVGFSRLHVFRYSPRPRTRAAEMSDQIGEPVKKARSEKLIELGRACMRRFAGSLVGQTLDVLVESRSRSIQQMIGYADNYAEVVFPSDQPLRGEIVGVKITGVDQDGRASGTPVFRDLG